MAKKTSLEATKISVVAKNDEQKEFIKTIAQNDITFVKGAPGSGKTYIAVAYGLQGLLQQKFEQLIFTRPVVEAGGERLGFLPGNMQEKIDPYMLPIFDTLNKLIPPHILSALMPKNGNGVTQPPIRILPLAYMRGITFVNSYVVSDEMQNSTPEQMRMLLTRLGHGSKMVLCGDVYQTDISRTNGLQDAFDILQDIEGVGFVTLTQDAIMRHPIIKQIEQRYLEQPTKKHKYNAR